MDIRNIFCIGRNYADHAAELGNEVPDKPIVFLKPTHSLVQANGLPLEYPNDLGEIHHELEIVLYIGKNVVDEPLQVNEVVTKMSLGIDFTLRDVQSALKRKGHPWLLAKGIKHSAITTEFWVFPGEAACRETNFYLRRDGIDVQTGNISSMIFPIHSILTYIHKNFGLAKGDLIYTGTPKGVGPIADGERYELWWGDELKGQFGVRLSS